MKRYRQTKALNMSRIALCMMCGLCIMMTAVLTGCGTAGDMEKNTDPGQSSVLQDAHGDISEEKQGKVNPLDVEIIETQQGERAFSITLEDFIKSYNSFYRADHGKTYLGPVLDWQTYTAVPTVHMNHETGCYTFSEDETVRALPVLSVYADGGSSPVQQISVSYDEHSYSPETYEMYEEMCFYTLQVMFGAMASDAVGELRDLVAAATEESFTTDQTASGKLPTFLYYAPANGIGVYPHFVVGQSAEIRVIPVPENYLEELVAAGVEIRTIE